MVGAGRGTDAVAQHIVLGAFRGECRIVVSVTNIWLLHDMTVDIANSAPARTCSLAVVRASASLSARSPVQHLRVPTPASIAPLTVLRCSTRVSSVVFASPARESLQISWAAVAVCW